MSGIVPILLRLVTDDWLILTERAPFPLLFLSIKTQEKIGNRNLIHCTVVLLCC